MTQRSELKNITTALENSIEGFKRLHKAEKKGSIT